MVENAELYARDADAYRTAQLPTGYSDTDSSSDTDEDLATKGPRPRRRSKLSQPQDNAFTLRRIFVWIQDPFERLRLMAMLVDAARGQSVHFLHLPFIHWVFFLSFFFCFLLLCFVSFLLFSRFFACFLWRE